MFQVGHNSPRVSLYFSRQGEYSKIKMSSCSEWLGINYQSYFRVLIIPVRRPLAGLPFSLRSGSSPLIPGGGRQGLLKVPK